MFVAKFFSVRSATRITYLMNFFVRSSNSNMYISRFYKSLQLMKATFQTFLKRGFYAKIIKKSHRTCIRLRDRVSIYRIYCNSCRCLRYPINQHRILHSFRHVNYHKTIPEVRKNIFPIWPEVLYELIEDCKVKISAQKQFTMRVINHLL